MIVPTTLVLSDLYETDETAWLEVMAKLIEQDRLTELDFDHLAEYLSDMARRDRREVKSRMSVLLAHLLKWQFQPEKRSRSWKATIVTQRQELADLAGSGVLRAHAESILADAWSNAIEQASSETGLPTETFPVECAYTLEQLLVVDVTSPDH